MKLKLLMLLAAMGTAGNAMAVNCYFSDPVGHYTENLISSSETLKLRADAPVDHLNPIGVSKSNPMAGKLTIVCPGTKVVFASREILDGSLLPYPNYPGYYQTSLKGIGVKFGVTGRDSPASDVIPRDRYQFGTSDDPTVDSAVAVMSSSYFTASFYKLEKKISLSPAVYQQSVTVLSPRLIGNSKLEDLIYSIYHLGNIDLISVPVCTVDQPQKVDFGIVTADNVRDGSSQDLNFGMLCYTDYDSYNAVASISAANRTPDGQFIAVTDIQGNSDSLIIEIIGEHGQKIKVDGSTTIDAPATESGVKANFKWKAILRQKNGSPAPARGKFTASAIITLDLK